MALNLMPSAKEAKELLILNRQVRFPWKNWNRPYIRRNDAG